MPEFIFLIGAAKSGTTKLADMLNMHPDICLSSPKEPDFFTDRVYDVTQLDNYHDLFTDKNARFCLDASTSYAAGWHKSSANTAARIAKHQPGALIIYLYRNPVKRTWSSYWHGRRAGTESRALHDALHDEDGHHIQGSLYRDRVQDYLAHFDKDQIMIIQFEDFVRRPHQYANTIFSRLGLPDHAFDKDEQEGKVNESFQWRGGFSVVNNFSGDYVVKLNSLAKLVLPGFLHEKIKNLVSKPVPELDPETHRLLEQRFQGPLDEFVEEYADLIVKPE